MKKTTPETEPRLFKAEGKITTVLTGDPSVTIIEAHDALGFLLSESCYDSMDGAHLHLENVTWVRQPYKEDPMIFRTLSSSSASLLGQ